EQRTGEQTAGERNNPGRLLNQPQARSTGSRRVPAPCRDTRFSDRAIHCQAAASRQLSSVLTLRASRIPAILKLPRSESFVVFAIAGRPSSFKVEQAPFMLDNSYKMTAGATA